MSSVATGSASVRIAAACSRRHDLHDRGVGSDVFHGLVAAGNLFHHPADPFFASVRSNRVNVLPNRPGWEIHVVPSLAGLDHGVGVPCQEDVDPGTSVAIAYAWFSIAVPSASARRRGPLEALVREDQDDVALLLPAKDRHQLSRGLDGVQESQPGEVGRGLPARERSSSSGRGCRRATPPIFLTMYGAKAGRPSSRTMFAESNGNRASRRETSRRAMPKSNSWLPTAIAV